MDSYKIPIRPLEGPAVNVYIRRNGPALWIAQSEYFFRIPILGGEYNDVRLEPGTPIKLPRDISIVYVSQGRVMIDWSFPGGYLDITDLVHQDENGELSFISRRSNPS